jgi:hypothetical protein
VASPSTLATSLTAPPARALLLEAH